MDEGRARALLRAERAELGTRLRQAGVVDDARQVRERVAAIDRALARIEAGAFGCSVLSGRPIPEQRLEADPAAELTMDEASTPSGERRARG